MKVEFDEKKGDLTITCKHGNKVNRASQFGLHCNLPDCKCDKRNRETMPDLNMFFKKIMAEM